MNRRSLAALLFAAVTGCGGADAHPAGAAPIRVFAAASLTAPFEAVARAFEAAHPGQKVDVHFAGSPTLVLQIHEGAAVDVFASADDANMRKVVDAGHAAAAPVAFARNHLAIAVAAGNPKGIRELADLARQDLKVALCGPEVPAGKYAREALHKAQVAVASLSDEPNVKALVGKVQLGELDAGIVFVTDTRGPGVTGVGLPAAHDVTASYPIVVLRTGRNGAGGRAFVDFVRGPQGQALLAEHGFTSP